MYAISQFNFKIGYETPVAEPVCYDNDCTCSKGYKYSETLQVCQNFQIEFPADQVFCDNDGAQCSRDARCVYDRSNDHSVCECNEGFVGDGFDCQKIMLRERQCQRNKDCTEPNEKMSHGFI